MTLAEGNATTGHHHQQLLEHLFMARLLDGNGEAIDVSIFADTGRPIFCWGNEFGTERGIALIKAMQDFFDEKKQEHQPPTARIRAFIRALEATAATHGLTLELTEPSPSNRQATALTP